MPAQGRGAVSCFKHTQVLPILHNECPWCASLVAERAAGRADALAWMGAKLRHEIEQHPYCDGWIASWLDAIEEVKPQG